MGTYINPSNQLFRESLNSQIYVDKTESIMYLNTVVSTEQKYLAVSRPRRFGKTMAANMICAYYGDVDSRELFDQTKLKSHDGWDRYLGKYDVVKIVMTDFLSGSSSAGDMTAYITEEVTSELMEKYEGINYGKRINLNTVMSKIYSRTGRRFVIVIDEWDAVFREWMEDKEGQKVFLDFLRDWLKNRDYIALVYMTGILPIKKYGKHSALNMFDEYSMLFPMQLAEYTGLTAYEVESICSKYGRDYETIREWYDGYEVSSTIPPDPDYHIQKIEQNELKPEKYQLYSPLSVVKAVSTGLIKNYWNNTETYEALAEYIRMNLDGLKDAVVLMMDGGRVRVDTSGYENDMTTFHGRDDVLTLLVHLGYLSYDDEKSEVFIPNKEILDEFKTSTKSEDWVDTFKSFKTSLELLDAIWNMAEEKTAELFELAHDKAANKTYNDEAALSYGIQYALYAAQKYYTTIQELDSGKGYADLVYIPAPKYPDKPALIVELKYNKTVKTAADQIRGRNYPQLLEHYAGNTLLVSINYNKDATGDEFKKHSCKIECL